MLDGFQNNIGNYKGVMLCTRPNENVNIVRERPFVSRVEGKDQIGLNPTKKAVVHVHKPRSNPILNRHRQWLEGFKEKIRQQKEEGVMDQVRDVEKKERVRELAANSRTKTKDLKDEYDNIGASETFESPLRVEVQPINVQKITRYADEKPAVQKKAPEGIPAVKAGGNPMLNEKNLKKLEEESARKELERLEQQYNIKADEIEKPKSILKQKKNKEKAKPKWAYTEDELANKEDDELNELLEFTNNLDYDRYINDLEVRNMIISLKNKIDDLSKEEDWKKKAVARWNDEDDTRSQRSAMALKKVDIDSQSQVSEGRSVTSEKTIKSIQSLKEQALKKERNEQDWDKSTTSKEIQAGLEDRIAKHIADEIIRNNKAMGQVHSNTSIRKLLEKEARKHLEAGGGVAEPKIAQNKDYYPRTGGVDPSNLPYLHRNPAV